MATLVSFVLCTTLDKHDKNSLLQSCGGSGIGEQWVCMEAAHLLVRRNAEQQSPAAPWCWDLPTISLAAQSRAEVGGLFISLLLFTHLLFITSLSVYIVYIINHMYSHTSS